MPSIGYGSNKKTRHLMPDGFKKFVIHNVKVKRSVLLVGKKLVLLCVFRWCGSFSVCLTLKLPTVTLCIIL